MAFPAEGSKLDIQLKQKFYDSLPNEWVESMEHAEFHKFNLKRLTEAVWMNRKDQYYKDYCMIHKLNTRIGMPNFAIPLFKKFREKSVTYDSLVNILKVLSNDIQKYVESNMAFPSIDCGEKVHFNTQSRITMLNLRSFIFVAFLEDTSFSDQFLQLFLDQLVIPMHHSIHSHD